MSSTSSSSSSSSSGAASSSLRAQHEDKLKSEPQNKDSLHYLALWHLERNNFTLARQFFACLVSLQVTDPSIWLSFSIVCAIDGELQEAHQALAEVSRLVPQPEDDVRIRFCQGLLCERRQRCKEAMDLYYHCIEQCELKQGQEEARIEEALAAGELASEADALRRVAFFKVFPTSHFPSAYILIPLYPKTNA